MKEKELKLSEVETVQADEVEVRAELLIREAYLDNPWMNTIVFLGYPPVDSRHNFDTRKHVLSPGTKSLEVKIAQAFCNIFHRKTGGFWSGSQILATDGSYGPATQKQIKVLQRASGIAQDGLCGPATWKAMYYDWYLKK